MPPIPPSYEIDPTICGIALRAVTDELALLAKRPTESEDIKDVLSRLFELSARGRSMLRTLLEPHYPDVAWSADEAHPDHSVLETPGRNWIYDPIDGAYHYEQGLPLWSASLALVEDGRVIMALVYNPTQAELFVASHGQGTTMNGRALHVSLKQTLAAAVVGTALPIYGYGDSAVHVQALRQIADVSRHVFVVRQMASASLQLAYVAAGRLDAYWETGRDLHDWAAGALLVREAGGQTVDFDGASFWGGGEGIIATSKALLPSLRDAIMVDVDSLI